MNWKKVLQLTLVHTGVALTAVPISGTLNRIMIADLHLSALLVSLLVSLPNLLSPLQVLMGAWADKRPLWGRHRSPWMVVGGLMAAFGSYFTAHAVHLIPDGGALGLLTTFVVFLIWGVGVNIASVSYLSLLSELTVAGSGWRTRAISFMWTVMILSSIAMGITVSRLLEPYSTGALYTAFGLVWFIALILILVGAAGIEPKTIAGRLVQNSANNPLIAFRILANNPSAKRFFIYLLLVLIGVRGQDVLLEPYGGEVLKLPVAVTTRLESIWGVGVFITLIGGFWLVRRYGKKSVANVGSLVSVVAFGLIIYFGYVINTQGFMGAVLLLGLGGGLMTVSNLSFMLDMTIPAAAGLYMGAWGVANFAGQAIGNIGSGFLRDVLYQTTGNPLIGYAAVFGLEAIAILYAVWYFRTISVEQFRREAEMN
jgi:MFS transporter, BCD family, chlorophyll transporter